jgi:hypothetical protein
MINIDHTLFSKFYILNLNPLNISVCPFIIKDGLKNQKVPRGSTAILECEILNNLAPSDVFFKWKKNGQILDIDYSIEKYEYIRENNTHKLVIKNFDDSDIAEYSIFLAEPSDYDLFSNAKIEIEGIKLL